MPIVSSQIISQTVQVDGRISVVERHRDHRGVHHDIPYLADVGMDIEEVLAIRASNLGIRIDMLESVEAEAANFELPISQVEFLKRFTVEERKAVYEAKRTDTEVEDVWNFTTAAINGVHLGNPLTAYGLSVLEAKGLIAPGRKAIIGAA